ncbi:MAG: ArsR family transcriptional regulator [Candidatus Saliniplasma sp.]
MARIKVIKDVSDFVPILRAVSSQTKKEVFTDLAEGWRTEDEINEEYGEEGVDALKHFEKMKLVETRWQHTDTGTKKAYHTYYSSVHIDASVPVQEISEVLYAAMVSSEEFKELEEDVLKYVREGDNFAKDIAEKIECTPITLKSLVKRSLKLDYRGHRIMEVEEE